jgi:hypothetical protein
VRLEVRVPSASCEVMYGCVEELACRGGGVCLSYGSCQYHQREWKLLGGGLLQSGVMPEGMMFNAPFSFTYTFANCDRYLLSGNVFGVIENVSNFQATYLGNAAGTSSGGCSGGGFRAGLFRSS